MKIKILKSILIVCFGLLLYNHCFYFTANYIKFSTIEFINDNKLHYAYYYFIFVEMLLIVHLLFDLQRLNFLINILFGLYLTLILFLLINFERIANNCINCHFVAKMLFENYKITAVSISLLGILYFYLQWLIKRSAK